MQFEITPDAFVGPHGSLSIDPDDELSLKIAMLLKGECGSDTPSHVAAEFGFSRQRYFQLRALFHSQGLAGLIGHRRGPKTNYRRTREVVCQVVRYRFLDPDASSEVIAQKLRQNEFYISARSVERVLAEFGLQKKTLSVSPGSNASVSGDLSNTKENTRRVRRSRKS
jgi:hypothetical protein